MSAGERPSARPQSSNGGRSENGPRRESDPIVERISPPPRLEREDGFGAWEPRLRAGQIPSVSEPRITWRRAAREIARATGIAVILALAGLMVAVVVWQLAELIDILIR